MYICFYCNDKIHDNEKQNFIHLGTNEKYNNHELKLPVVVSYRRRKVAKTTAQNHRQNDAFHFEQLKELKFYFQP